jgi:hypothetical protein
LSDDGELSDFAEVWVEANRSRALILWQYFSGVVAALAQRSKHQEASLADEAKPGLLPGRTDMAIVESAGRSGSK